jgi:hypothetical protein
MVKRLLHVRAFYYRIVLVSAISFKKVFRIVPLLYIMAVVLFSAAFVFTHLDHDCCGADCPVCLQIEVVGGVLRGFAAMGAVGGVFVMFRYRSPCSCRLFYRAVARTPITLKVQLNT